MGAANRSVLTEESCQVHGTAGGLSLRSSFCDGPVDAKGEEKGAQGVALLCSSFAGDLLGAKQNDTVVRVAQVALSGQTERHSSDLTEKTGPPWSRGAVFRRCRVSGAIV